MPDLDTVRAFLEPSHVELAARVTAFGAQELAPLTAAENDATARNQARLLLAKMGKAGLFSSAVPQTYGGRTPDPDLRACALIRETLASFSPLADAVFALQCLGSMPITLAGEEPQKKRWLPAVAKGEAMAAFAMTEPEAGSDVGAMKTSATRDGEVYVLEGKKTLISNAGIADFYVVFASTDPAKGNKGITAFAVDAKTPGVKFERAQILSAPHPLGELSFVRCRVPASCRIGAEGDGFKIGMTTLDRLRPTVAAAACGMAERALQESITHLRRRKQFGKPLADFQILQQKIARMATDLAASRLLVYRAAWARDRGAERITVESSMAKVFATEAAQRIVDDAVQILGGIGVLADHPVDRLYRAVRALRIYEGTTEVLQTVIAGHLLKSAGGTDA